MSFAEEVKGGPGEAVSTKSQSKRKKKSKKKNDDEESLIDRIVEESKESIVQQRAAQETTTISEGTASSFSSYDKIESKGRYKCKACLQGFMSKN